MKGIINANIWVIIGRLTFSVFLSHILVIVFVTSVMFNFKFPTTIGSLVSDLKSCIELTDHFAHS